MKGQEVLFTSARTQGGRDKGSTDCWGTPQAFFDMLHEEFGFTLDPCADETNAKCSYFDVNDDGLAQDWGENVCFVNFPYSQAKAWAAKCVAAASAGATVVVLCAARTDTGWWQNLASVAEQIRFVRGRLAFVGPTGTGQSATFPSSVIVLRPHLAQHNARDEDGHGDPLVFFWEVPAEVRR